MKFSVYEGKTSNQVEKGLGANVVLGLSEDFHCRYHHIYFDNFFMGIDLMLNLLRKGTYACGTMRSNRKGFPESLKGQTKRGLPNRGYHKMVQSKNLCVSGMTRNPYLAVSPTPTPLHAQSPERKRMGHLFH